MVVYRNFSKGRLGNRLFFIASTIGIALKNKTNYYFGSDLGEYQKIFENDLPITDIIPTKLYNQEKFSFYDIKISEDTELEGYYQSEKFFMEFKDEVLTQLKFKEEFIKFAIDRYPSITNSASIHIRRGDYLNQLDYHPVLPIQYYNYIIENYLYEFDNIFVFSDDEEWCKNTFTSNKFIFPKFDDDNDLLSFVLMSQSKNIVISNSSYSWWAAWLNRHKEKKIFAPHHKMWFGPNYSNLETIDIIPDDWIKIEI